MGSFSNIKLAKDGICNLVIGAPPGKLYSKIPGAHEPISGWWLSARD
eukprot:gene30898-38188_t